MAEEVVVDGHHLAPEVGKAGLCLLHQSRQEGGRRCAGGDGEGGKFLRYIQRCDLMIKKQSAAVRNFCCKLHIMGYHDNSNALLFQLFQKHSKLPFGPGINAFRRLI